MPKSTSSRRPLNVLEVLYQYNLPEDFPLSPHVPTRRWYRKIAGRRVYFGPLDEPKAALERYLDESPALQAGRDPATMREGATVRDVLNLWLHAKAARVDSGELRQCTFDAYLRASEMIRDVLGARTRACNLCPADFGRLRAKWSKRYGPSEMRKQIGYIKSALKHAYESELIDKVPRFGPDFKPPGRAVQRKLRHSKPMRLFEAADLRKLIDDAGTPLKALILLGINCGWGATDVASLPFTCLDLENGIADFPRVKSGIERRAILWSETIDALREAIDHRPSPRDPNDKGIVFITRQGHRWARYIAAGTDRNRNGDPDTPIKGSWVDSVALQFNKLLKKHDLKAKGVGYYSLRHSFQTIADEQRDFPAIMKIMGHAEHTSDMSARYREKIDDDRLKAVTDHVHNWLYPAAPPATRKRPVRRRQTTGRAAPSRRRAVSVQ